MSHFQLMPLRIFNNKIWNVLKVIIDPQNDLFKLAKEQAKLKSKFTMASSQSGKVRDNETKYQRQLMGCMAEIYADEFLKEFLLEFELNYLFSILRYDNVRTDGYKSAANEFDLKMVASFIKQSYTIECRSSIVFNRSLENAIEQFDIIGPYSSTAKEGEKYCHIYIRPLFEVVTSEQKNYTSNDFEKLISAGFINLYIAGGCFRSDMIEKGYQKSMKQNETNYRVVKLTEGFDAIEFKEQLKERIKIIIQRQNSSLKPGDGSQAIAKRDLII
jgi:hypothetical protein